VNRPEVILRPGPRKIVYAYNHHVRLLSPEPEVVKQPQCTGVEEPRLLCNHYHPSFQTIAFLMEETGEYDERELNHSEGEAERFYRDLQRRGIRVRVGMKATGYSRWFERLRPSRSFSEF
jgi:hypothetical protein